MSYKCNNTECTNKTKYSDNWVAKTPDCNWCKQPLTCDAPVGEQKSASVSFKGAGWPTKEIKNRFKGF